MNLNELEGYFLERNTPKYERESYDSFLKKEGFSFSVPSIHITGTNGKGSTANYIYQIYLAKGYKVGLYNSPYLETCLEMISINGNRISEEEYISTFLSLEDKFEKYGLTSFEMQTIIAFEIFKKHSLDLVVIEVGMGGFIDATNIITPVLSIITSISFEHTAYLGASLSEIAYNKAGIIKPEVPVLVGKLDESAMFAIRERIKLLKCPLTVVDDYHNEKINGNNIIFDYLPYHDLKISTAAKYELKNAALAIEGIKILSNRFDVDEESIKKGLETPCLDCRFDFVKENLLLDGAHNPEAINNLVETLKTYEKPIHIVFASFRDKNIDSMLTSLNSISSDIRLTTFNHKRARNEMDYFLYLEDYSFEEDYKKLISSLVNEYPDDLILVTGSLAFCGVVKGYLKNG